MQEAYIVVRLLVLISIVFGQENELTKNGTKPKPGNDFPIGDPRRCIIKGTPKYRFEVLPGGGWDNLRNKEMGMIVKLNYSQCRTTDDGRFLLPDGVFTIPLKSSKVETYAELIEHWDNFTSTLSRSVNVHAGLHLSHVGISGKFSAEYESVKSRQHYDKSVTTRIQARYLQYTSKLEPDTPVNEAFRKRLYKIAASHMLNRTDQARYDSQLLVRDFGTHVITSIDVGAALVQLDQINVDYMKKSDSHKSSVLASASASFFGVFDFGASYSQSASASQINEYRSQRTSSHVLTYGGPVYRPSNFSANKWSDAVENDLVALDRGGDPIFYLVTDVNLPNVPQSVIYDVYDYVKDAVALYYEHNAHRGCTNSESPNFSFQANIDDGSCKPPRSNFTFGGVYQTCSKSGIKNLCDKMTQKNPQTGDYNCPVGYEAILLQEGSSRTSEARRECHRCHWFFHCCSTNTYVSTASYAAYWCAATGQVKSNSGFLFGGLFTQTTSNVVTQSQSCPLKFYPVKLLKELTICISDDYELGYQYSLPFAGFYTCKAGNPLALAERKELLKSSSETSMLTSFMLASGPSAYPHGCPEGYSQHLAEVDDGCSINYCVKTGSLSAQGLPIVQRPPYVEAPRDGFQALLPASSSVVFDDIGDMWTTENSADQVIPGFLKQLGIELPQGITSNVNTSPVPNGSNSSKLSGGSIAAITLSATLVCVVLATIVVLKIRRRRVRYRETDPWSGQEENRRIREVSATLGYTQIPPSVTSA
ncbi:macrophage-expressed gene 1 protein-like [Mya arenaria]|nr:macrophage-expressed gene 1 protein-like [Mya arenaria]